MNTLQNILIGVIFSLILALTFLLCCYANQSDFDKRIQKKILEQNSDKILIKNKNFFYRTLKRLFDMIFGLIGVIAFLPVNIIISIMIKHEDHGPIFSKVYFYGYKGKKKKYYRFRTTSIGIELTSTGADKEDKQFINYTRIGHVLESTSLELLPIYFSVLKGDLTLIGLKRIPWFETDNINESYKRLYDYERPGVVNLGNGLRKLKADSEMTDRIYIQSRGIIFDMEMFFYIIKNGFIHPETNNGKDAIKSRAH